MERCFFVVVEVGSLLCLSAPHDPGDKKAL
jgi:hypothetical protein